jgi:hypothetical protein
MKGKILTLAAAVFLCSLAIAAAWSFAWTLYIIFHH